MYLRMVARACRFKIWWGSAPSLDANHLLSIVMAKDDKKFSKAEHVNIWYVWGQLYCSIEEI